MNDLMKGLGRVCLGSLAGAGLGAASFFAVDALMPQPSAATTVADILNVADMNFRVGNQEVGCTMVSLAIMQANQGNATSSQRAEIAGFARRCGLRF